MKFKPDALLMTVFRERLLLLLLCSGLPLFLLAQTAGSISAGTRSVAMGGVRATLTDIGAAWGNQAGLAHVEAFTAAVQAERRFGLAELQSIGAAAALPTGSGVWGLTLHSFGFELYSEQRAGLAYGRKLTDNFSLGAQMLLFNHRIEEYGSRLTFSFELGLMAELSPKLSFGVHAANPMRVEVAPGENLPTVFRLGFNYRPSGQIALLAEVEKDIEFGPRVKTGIDYRLVDALSLRIGVATEPTEITFGAGYKVNAALAVDVSAAYHQILGFTPAVGVVYTGK